MRAPACPERRKETWSLENDQVVQNRQGEPSEQATHLVGWHVAWCGRHRRLRSRKHAGVAYASLTAGLLALLVGTRAFCAASSTQSLFVRTPFPVLVVFDRRTGMAGEVPVSCQLSYPDSTLDGNCQHFL